MKKHYFFIHGGPGFTSKPEEKILTPLLKSETSLYFWNELSPLRGDKDLTDYFTKNLNSLKSSLMEHLKNDPNTTPIFFSFGLQYLFHLPDELINQFKKIIVLSPAVDLKILDRNIFQLALADLKQSNPASYDQLSSMVKNLGPDFDKRNEEAFLLATTAPTLFTNYFNSEKAMMDYFTHLTGEFSFSIDSFLAIRRTIPATPLRKISVETLAVFGKADPITPYKDQNPALMQRFTHLKSIEVELHKHFLHIEKPEILLNCL